VGLCLRHFTSAATKRILRTHATHAGRAGYAPATLRAHLHAPRLRPPRLQGRTFTLSARTCLGLDLRLRTSECRLDLDSLRGGRCHCAAPPAPCAWLPLPCLPMLITPAALLPRCLSALTAVTYTGRDHGADFALRCWWNYAPHAACRRTRTADLDTFSTHTLPHTINTAAGTRAGGGGRKDLPLLHYAELPCLRAAHRGKGGRPTRTTFFFAWRQGTRHATAPLSATSHWVLPAPLPSRHLAEEDACCDMPSYIHLPPSFTRFC